MAQSSGISNSHRTSPGRLMLLWIRWWSTTRPSMYLLRAILVIPTPLRMMTPLWRSTGKPEGRYGRIEVVLNLRGLHHLRAATGIMVSQSQRLRFCYPSKSGFFNEERGWQVQEPSFQAKCPLSRKKLGGTRNRLFRIPPSLLPWQAIVCSPLSIVPESISAVTAN